MNKKSTENTYSNFAILVLSCDKYSDIWKPFFSQFTQYWPECPFKVYLGSNTKKYNGGSVQTILSGAGIDWSSDLLNILRSIKEEYVFVWMEDLFLVNTVDTDLFLRGFQFMEKMHGNHMHMSPYIRPDGVCADTLFGYYEKGIPYRINAPGFWNRRHLQELLIPGENPWKFEIMGSYRARYYEDYYSINKPLFQFIRTVEKGTLTREAYIYCKKNHIELDLDHRGVNTFIQEIRSYIEKYIFYAITRIPWKMRVAFMDALRRIVISY